MQTDIKTREAELAIVLGTNGTGKTTLLKKLVIAALKNKDRVLIVTPDFVEWTNIKEIEPLPHKLSTFKGARRIVYDNDETLHAIMNNYGDGMLVYDDCRSYFRSNIGEKIREQFIRRRQHKLDIFFVGHGFTEVPPVVFTFANTIILFKTRDNIARRKNYMQDYDLMVKKQTEINHKAEKNHHYFEIIPQ